MKTLIILMFIMLIVLLALNIALYINFDKRISYLKYLCTNSFKEFIDCINKASNQHCDFTKKAIDKSTDYYYKSFKIVLEGLKAFSDDLDEFTEHIGKSIKEINCTKKKSNNKEIKID